jgi:DNA-binding MarR family transcriptional regulator
MAKEILKQAVGDLLSLPPVLHRTMRQKVTKATYGDMFEKITSIHSEIIRLLDEEGPMNIGAIGDQLMIAKAQMTQLIDKLVALKIVERRAVKGDRRKIEIALTPAGKRLLQEHKKNMDKTFMEVISSLTEKDLKAFSDALITVKDVLAKLR